MLSDFQVQYIMSRLQYMLSDFQLQCMRHLFSSVLKLSGASGHQAEPLSPMKRCVCVEPTRPSHPPSDPMQVLLPEAHRLAYEAQRLRRRDFRGSELLALLHALSRCGSPVLQSVMQRLLWHCNQVLLRQLSSW